MKYEIELNIISPCKVSIGDIADKFAELTNEKQAVFLHELFDALKHRCKERFEFQLNYIADYVVKSQCDDLKYVFETLHEFTNKPKTDE